MKLIENIKNFVKTVKGLKKYFAESKEKKARALTMTTEELASLSDDDLLFAAIARVEDKVDGFDEPEDGIASLNRSQKVVYVLNLLESDMEYGGGLYYFFTISGRTVAPLVSEYMRIVGADEHRKLFDDFVFNNRINLNQFSFFDMEAANEFDEEAYPFEEYEKVFSTLEPIETYLRDFVRNHKEDF